MTESADGLGQIQEKANVKTDLEKLIEGLTLKFRKDKDIGEKEPLIFSIYLFAAIPKNELNFPASPKSEIKFYDTWVERLYFKQIYENYSAYGMSSAEFFFYGIQTRLQTGLPNLSEVYHLSEKMDAVISGVVPVKKKLKNNILSKFLGKCHKSTIMLK